MFVKLHDPYTTPQMTKVRPSEVVERCDVHCDACDGGFSFELLQLSILEKCCSCRFLKVRSCCDSKVGDRTRGYGEDKNRAAYLHGNSMVRGMALHHRVPALGVLERCSRNRVVAVLSRRPPKLAGALIE